jgi:hypothetical protein
MLEDSPLAKKIFEEYGVTLFTIKENVFYNDVEIQDSARCNSFDYTDSLKELNKYCVETRTTLIYQEYTGRVMNVIAEIFQNNIIHNLDHIIYGLGERDDAGCYLDFTDDKYDLLIKYDDNICHIYNPYYYLYNSKHFSEAIDLFGIENIHNIIKKNKNVKKILSKYFNDYILSTLRIFYILIKDKDQVRIFDHVWKQFEDNEQEFKSLYESCEYTILFEKIKEFFSKNAINKRRKW